MSCRAKTNCRRCSDLAVQESNRNYCHQRIDLQERPQRFILINKQIDAINIGAGSAIAPPMHQTNAKPATVPRQIGRTSASSVKHNNVPNPTALSGRCTLGNVFLMYDPIRNL
jgi:hypothetical protein